MRAAIYARYSSDLQSPTSIADQVRLCRERAAAIGADVFEVYADAAISGASAVNRPGLQNMMAAARERAFDVVISEAIDRLSRDLEDIAAIHKRLRHADVRILTIAEGEISELHIGFKGTMSALFLRDLAQKIRRGQRGRVEAGKSPGGLAYGYRVVRALTADGEVLRGGRSIDEAQAATIRRIFADYVAGRSPRAIAASLNAESVPSPRGGQWNASTIVGSRARRNGILHNELYVGRLIYNRQAFRKDPETGRRTTRSNDCAQWISADVPELRIVDHEIWQRAQAIKEEAGARPLHLRRRPKRLLSGLIRCGLCGGPFALHNDTRLGCSRRKERGICSNARTVKADDVETRVIDGLRERLLAPSALEAFVAEHRAGSKRRRAEDSAARGALEREGREIVGKVRRIIEAIETGADTPSMRRRLVELERREAAIAADLEAAGRPTVVDLHPNLPEIYRRSLDQLGEALQSDPAERARAIELVRRLVEKILVYPEERRGEVRLELHGQLAALLSHSAPTRPAIPRSRGMLVAAAGSGQSATSHSVPAIITLKGKK